MKSHFDELAKDLARGVSRREALGRFGVGLAALATGMILGRRTASAQEDCEAEFNACKQQASKQRSACERTCSSLRKAERAACVAACTEQYEAALAECVPCAVVDTCDNPGNCDTGLIPPCGGVEGCGCFTSAEGPGICAQGISCTGLTACTASSECPEGYACAVSTGCGCAVGVCLPLCSTTAATALRGDGRTASGFPPQN